MADARSRAVVWRCFHDIRMRVSRINRMYRDNILPLSDDTK